MEVIHLSVECFPIAKVGGLADVVGALPKYQRALGIDAKVVMPWFDCPFVKEQQFEVVATGSFFQGSDELQYEIHKEESDVLGFPLFLIKIPGKLDREEVYCYPDEAEQWIAFQHAFLHWIQNHGIYPSIIHCHDHHVGLIAFLLQHGVDFRNLADIRTIFTVHNGQYQGWMNWSKGILLPSFDTWKWGLLDWDGVINPLATAIKCSDAYTTVSDGYLNELFIDANGLQALFNAESGKAYGIVNGIDTAYWNPSSDQLIERNYNRVTVNRGKEENKQALCKQFNLPLAFPLISFIGRFAKEKGADLLFDICVKLFSVRQNVSVFILGSGDREIQNGLVELQLQFEGKINLFFGYDEKLAHQVYAASDMLLMPSRVEPCGLNQLYALKYGTIPIVRGIGGLRDTVVDVLEEGYGFVFEKLNADEAVKTIERSLDMYTDNKIWKGIRKKAMQLDFSWKRSAQKYVELYNQLLK